MANRAPRCPFCVTTVPRRSFVKRLVAGISGKDVCARCGRTFSRRLGQHVAHLYDHLVSDFEERLAAELKALGICDRAEVLVQFGLKMENARVASVDMLLRSLAETLEPQLAGLARGYEGRLNIRRVEKGGCAVVDIDAMVEDGKHTRRRLRIARIDANGFIQSDLDRVETVQTKPIAR